MQGRAAPDIPLRRIAIDALDGEAEPAVRALAALDLFGYVRTDIMGWHLGHVTLKGRERARSLLGHPDR